VSLPDDQVAEVKRFYSEIASAREGGITYLLLRDAPLPPRCAPPRMDLLLCPFERDGYSNRLFFAERVQCSKGLNWNGGVRVLERNWYAFSWRVAGGLRLLQMVQEHLRALR
jgi:hypothetical protein